MNLKFLSLNVGKNGENAVTYEELDDVDLEKYHC